MGIEELGVSVTASINGNVSLNVVVDRIGLPLDEAADAFMENASIPFGTFSPGVTGMVGHPRGAGSTISYVIPERGAMLLIDNYKHPRTGLPQTDEPVRAPNGEGTYQRSSAVLGVPSAQGIAEALAAAQSCLLGMQDVLEAWGYTEREVGEISGFVAGLNEKTMLASPRRV